MRTASRSVVAAVASRTQAVADAYAHEWSIPRAVEGYEALLAREDIDAVYVPLPNALHAEWTVKALAAGKHVLCEKPLVTNPADVGRIREAARSSRGVVAEGFMYRHEPLTARVSTLIAEGAVGAVRAISSGFTYARSRAGDVRLSHALGGGALLDVGCYPVSYTCLLMRAEVQSALATACLTPEGVDEEFTGILTFSGQRSASLYAGFRGAYHTWLDVMGTEGHMTVPNPFKPGPTESIVLDRLGERHAIEVPGSEQPFVRQIEDFVSAVLDGTPPVVTLEESGRVARALHALARAAGRPEAST